MDENNLIVRNKRVVVQMVLAAIMILTGVILLQMSQRAPEFTGQDFTTIGNTSENTSVFRQPEFTEVGNCTPLFNSSRRMSYAYDISSPSPEGTISMRISYDFIGQESVDGRLIDIIEITANGSHKGLTMDPVWRMWLDSETGQCIEAVLNMGGGSISPSDVPGGSKYMLPMDCKEAQFGMPVVVCEEQMEGLSPVATETVKVPAGEFQTERYETPNDETMWIAYGMPIPVKFMFKSMGDYAVSELIYYEEK
ncbi:MAG: hypothetical protein ABIG39_04020 [Candidatus Micrarchaeota archaeon]